jgi:glutaredoxin
MRRRFGPIPFFLALFAAAFLAVTAVVPSRVAAQVELTPVHVFGSMRCQACAEARSYLEFVAKQEKARVVYHDVTGSDEAAELSKRVARHLKVSVTDYPLVIIGDKALVGWSDGGQGPKAVAELQSQRSAPRTDVVAEVTLQLAETAEEAGNPWFSSQIIILVLACLVGAGLIGTVIRRSKRGGGKPDLPLGSQ